MDNRSLVSCTDKELTAMMNTDEVDAFAEILLRHETKVYRLALLLTRDASLAEEVLARTFCETYNELKSGKPLGEIELDRLIIANALRHASELKRHACIPEKDLGVKQEELDFPLTGSNESPLYQWQISRLRSQLAHLLDRVPEDYRHLLVLHDIIGFSKVKIAQMMKRPIAEIRQHLNRSRLFTRAFVRQPEAYSINIPSDGSLPGRSCRQFDA